MKAATKKIIVLLNVSNIQDDSFIKYLLSSQCFDPETEFFKLVCEVSSNPYHLYSNIEPTVNLLLPRELQNHCYAILNHKPISNLTNDDIIYCSPNLLLQDNLVPALQSVPDCLDEETLMEYLNFDMTQNHHQALFWQQSLTSLPADSKGSYVVDLFSLPKQSGRFNHQVWIKNICERLAKRREANLCYAVYRDKDGESQYLAFDFSADNMPVNLQWNNNIENAFIFATVPNSQAQEIASAYDEQEKVHQVLLEYCDKPKQLSALQSMLPFLQSMDSSVNLDWIEVQPS